MNVALLVKCCYDEYHDSADDEFKDVRPVEDPEYEQAKQFLKGLKGSAQFGLQIEYTAFVLRGLKRGESMEEAIWYAQCEWDL